LSKNIEVARKVKLREFLEIQDNGREIDNLKYEEEVNNFFIDNIPIPTTLNLDARPIRTEDNLYTLSNVAWDA